MPHVRIFRCVVPYNIDGPYSQTKAIKAQSHVLNSYTDMCVETNCLSSWILCRYIYTKWECLINRDY